MRHSQLAETRFAPFSYFCTCWKVRLNRLAQAFLGHAKLGPTSPHLLADVNVHWVRPIPLGRDRPLRQISEFSSRSMRHACDTRVALCSGSRCWPIRALGRPTSSLGREGRAGSPLAIRSLQRGNAVSGESFIRQRFRPGARERCFADFAGPLTPSAARRKARCCCWSEAAAALVHHPPARFAQLSHTLRGEPFMRMLQVSREEDRRQRLECNALRQTRLLRTRIRLRDVNRGDCQGCPSLRHSPRHARPMIRLSPRCWRSTRRGSPPPARPERAPPVSAHAACRSGSQISVRRIVRGADLRRAKARSCNWIPRHNRPEA